MSPDVSVHFAPLKECHVYDFLTWTDYDDPLFSMYNFVEDEDTVGDWFRWKTRSPRDMYFAILVDGRAVGYMGLKNISLTTRTAEVGIILDRAVTDRGIGRKAMVHLMDYGFQTLGLERILLDVLPWNGRAIHLYRALGFEDIARAYRQVDLDREALSDPAFDPYRKHIHRLRRFCAVLVNQMEMTKGKWRRGI
ncbi:MAG: GNAT family N-acetyltransferase [Peptoniphilus sp.]|nr:GNAT family N-acetyltransferase [Peptoniphilus sp.]MDY3118229.1 GNAT family N-acetyltransferase [Peptoniphilus sp.]